MLHSACPVALGNKWIANKFIKENPNMLNTKYTKIQKCPIMFDLVLLNNA